MTESPIRWPERYAPGKAPVYVRNEISIAAPPERIWRVLVRAGEWGSWYANCSGVILAQGEDLSEGMCFRWKTFGVKLVSTVREWQPCERLAWDARATGVDAYHAWLFVPTTVGCTVITEETQYGILSRLQNTFVPNKMHAGHQSWLEGLAAKATSGDA